MPQCSPNASNRIIANGINSVPYVGTQRKKFDLEFSWWTKIYEHVKNSNISLRSIQSVLEPFVYKVRTKVMRV